MNIQSTQEEIYGGRYNVFDPSVSPFLSPSISQNFVVKKYLLCRCAYLKGIHFFLGAMAIFNLERTRLNILMKEFVTATPLLPLNRLYGNFVVMKEIRRTCKCAYTLKFGFRHV